jgi:DNA topoisomerase-2
MEKINIKDFLDKEYSNSALYNCYRMIASVVDGLKPSSRKVVYTIKKRNITSEIKVSRLAPAVAEETEYLHGEGSLQGVIINMTQNFIGTNNVSLLSPNGNFGSRQIPASSAPRYIFSKKSEDFDKFFDKVDDQILIKQEFEGSQIEPKFYVPTLPLLLLNGSEGMGTGFAQKILPRNQKDIIKAINDILATGDTRNKLIPYYKGFKGKIQPGATAGSWEIVGNYSIDNTTTITITEIPIGYSLSSYLKVLNKLVDDNVIKSFEDLCENDQFLFKLNVQRTFTKMTHEEILDKLKLIKRVTENYTCIDENNSIRVFESIHDILKYYISIRLDYYEKRRLFLIEKLKEEIDYLESTKFFILNVISGNIKINNVPKKKIEEQLEAFKEIIKKEDSYDHLLRMPLYSLTKEKVEEFLKQIKDKKEKLNYYIKSTSNELWKTDLEEQFGKR